MSDPTAHIFPRPREVTLRGGSATIPPGRTGREWLEALPRTIHAARQALAAPGEGSWRITRDAGVPAEGYHLEVTSEGARLSASDARGLLHGARAARALFALAEGALPCTQRGVPADPLRARGPIRLGAPVTGIRRPRMGRRHPEE